MLSRDEMSLIAQLCIEHDAWAITDAPYEHMVYAGHHHEIATWPGMRERTITISSLSKTWSCTGWRIGWIIAPPAQTSPIRKIHDFLTVGAPAPLQTAAAVGFAFGADYYNQFTSDYRTRREFLCDVLREVGFEFAMPEGCVLHLRRLLEDQRSRRRHVREVDDAGDRRRDRPGLELLLEEGRRSDLHALRVL